MKVRTVLLSFLLIAALLFGVLTYIQWQRGYAASYGDAQTQIYTLHEQAYANANATVNAGSRP